jgi:hypothetical protein
MTRSCPGRLDRTWFHGASLPLSVANRYYKLCLAPRVLQHNPTKDEYRYHSIRRRRSFSPVVARPSSSPDRSIRPPPTPRSFARSLALRFTCLFDVSLHLIHPDQILGPKAHFSCPLYKSGLERVTHLRCSRKKPQVRSIPARHKGVLIVFLI